MSISQQVHNYAVDGLRPVPPTLPRTASLHELMIHVLAGRSF